MKHSFKHSRRRRLLPGGVPRYLRVYDNEGQSADRYTVIFTGRAAVLRASGIAPQHPYLAMSGSPFHPQGFGQHGHTEFQPADTLSATRRGGYSWPPAIGRKCHLGRRIPFSALPDDCRTFALRDYTEIWGL